LLLYTLHVMAGLGPKEAMPETWTFLALFIVLGVSALWGNLGYLGMVVDQYRQADRQLREERLIQTARADQAEQNTQRLQALLAERDALAEDRERLLQVMTHEIRQPLHNASGVLQALREADAETASLRANPWSTRVDRAEEVLGEVRDVLDNVLQAASLLHHREPPPLAPTELAFLIDFCLLDLPLAQRERVDVQWRTGLATALMAQPLIRLALRNLLRNAFAHGGPQVTVQLRIEERRAPHWLVLAVVDDGPGLSPNPPSQESLRTDAANRPVQERHRSGLGLQIARQVMALHGGRLALENLSAGGFSAALQWPIDHSHADSSPNPRSSETGPARA
jgi:two-component system OmpR family sensor kinase